MSKPTTIKEAIKRWQEKHPGENIAEAVYVGFQFQWPPVEKMDNSLGALVKCEKLSLSTNMIEKIAGLNSLKHLRILSLARNYIKNIAGLDGVAETLEQLWLSYNIIERTRGFVVLKNLKVLYIGNNSVKEWVEFNRLNELTNLEELLFFGNPLMENMDPEIYKSEVARRLPRLKKLDGVPIFRDEGD